MKLPFTSLLSKKENAEYILALLLRDEHIHVVIFEQDGTNLRIAVHQKTSLKQSVESVEFDELLETLDKAISIAEAKLPEGSILQKTVFGVKQSWTEDAKIKKDYLVILKKLSEELDLQPIGFLVFAEAFAHLLQQEEGAPVSALLVEAGKKNTSITLLRAGRLGEMHTIENKDGPLTETVDALLKYFESVEILPSRIIILDATDNKRIDQAFISHSWSKSLPFLHVPQVTVLPSGFDTKSVLFGTAAQLGLEVDSSHEPKEPEEIQSHHPKIEEEKKDEHGTIEEETKQIMDPQAFGFVLDHDVASDSKEKAGEDTSHPAVPRHETVADTIAEIPEDVKEEMTGEKTGNENLASDGSLLFSGFRKVEQQIKESFEKKEQYKPPFVEERLPEEVQQKTRPTMGYSPPKKRINKLVFVVLFISFLGIAGIVAYLQFVKATVTLTVKPKVLDQQQDVILTADGTNDFANNNLSGSVVSFGEEGTLNTPATGTKNVGSPAKGTVTVYNKLTDSVTVQKGTTLTSSNGLKYTLDDAVTIASASGASDPTIPTTPGTAHVNVTAADIGQEYNLPSSTRFTFTGNSSVEAKNDNAFSGGTKKQITIVSKTDLDKVTGDLTKQLEDKAKSDLNSKSSGSTTVLPVFMKEDMTKKSIDKKVGDEAKTVTMQAAITFNAISYDKKSFDDYANFILKNKITPDVTLSSGDLKTDVANIKQKNDKQASITITVHAKLIPKIDTAKITQSITGKSFSDATSTLTGMQDISGVSIQLHPNLFFLPKILPRNENNITVVTNNND